MTEASHPSSQRSVLLVDLNNFARYPTLPIGYLAAVLRRANYAVTVFAPLMVGVQGVTREPRPHRFSLFAAKLNYRVATSSRDWVRRWRDRAASKRLSGISSHEAQVLAAVKAEIAAAKPQAVLISTYLMYRDTCAQICLACKEMGIPVIIGGPYFAQPDVIEAWIRLPGLSALVAGEVELRLPLILETLLAKNDPSVHAGVMTADTHGRPRGGLAPPLQGLDSVPYPDYSDFPWSAYPNRIVPVITGRGCGWGVCTFCSDVTSTAGRTYRSRSPQNVLSELSEHHQRFGVSRFVFTDLKLNSNIEMWRSIIGGMQDTVAGSRWIAAVHAGTEADNGLSESSLRAAAKSGCVRLTTGLETGSQRMADSMKKGTRLETISAFLHGTAQAGISARCTMILGHPGETADDVEASVEFLARHRRVIERVSLNRLHLVTGTTLHRAVKQKPEKFKGFAIVHENAGMAHVEHRHDIVHTASHRRAAMRLLTEVHRINSRELSAKAREFEGVM